MPITAGNRTLHRAVGPLAFDCVQVIVIRDGSAFLYSEFGERPVKIGDVIILGANTLAGWEPEGHVTFTRIDFDTDYLIDQVFWQYATVLVDRLDAEGFARTIYSEPAQVLRLGEERAGLLLPWLDELVRLSAEGCAMGRFNRVQALWFAVADVISPYVKVSPVRLTATQRARGRPTAPRRRPFAPLRGEVREIAALLREDLAYPWTLGELATRVHLSPSHFGRVFADAYGLTPLAYQRMLRAQRLAELLRTTDVPVEDAMREVGWHSRGHAARLFRQHVGLSPSAYRKRSQDRQA